MPPTIARIDRLADQLEELAKALRAEIARVRAEAEKDETLTIAEAAARFDIPPGTLRDWARKRPGLGIHRGGRWRINAAELRSLLARRS